MHTSVDKPTDSLDQDGAKSHDRVAVVLAVFDRAHMLESTIQSVLAQQGVHLEFVIVDDGASAAVKTVLKNHLNDTRIKIIEQPNAGLTKALIAGCEHVMSEFVARIDTGDQMCVNRLRYQSELLRSDSNLGLVCSNVELLSEEGYHLNSIEYSTDSLRQGLAISHAQDAEMATPFHASVMFRRSFYSQVGGYRASFYFAQDLDLWTRMIEVSDIACDQRVLTKAVFSATGISAKFALQQRQLKRLIIKLREIRIKGADESALLAEAEGIRPASDGPSNRALQVNEFAGNYFIAKCLFDRQSKHAGLYLAKALKQKPFSLKAWFFYFAWRVKGGNWRD